jgi:hypothetical protein
MKTRAEMELINYCRWNDDKGLIKVLEKYHDLDLTITDGLCFQLAIKHKNVNMVNILLNYYQTAGLQGDRESMEYKEASYRLQKILEEAIDSFEVSPEIQESLNPYIATADSGDEQDLSGFEDDIELLDSVEHAADFGLVHKFVQ